MPIYLGDESKWRKFTKKMENVTLSSGLPDSIKSQKNALMALNDMYRGLEFKIVEKPRDTSNPSDRESRVSFVASVNVEGHTYEGSGSTKKAAKLAAAEKALLGLAITGVLAQKAAVKKTEKPSPQRNWGSFRGGGGSSNGASGGGWANTAGIKRNHSPWLDDGQMTGGGHNGPQSMYGTGRGRGGNKRGRIQNRGRGSYSQRPSYSSGPSQSHQGMGMRGRGGLKTSPLSSGRGTRGGGGDGLLGMSSSYSQSSYQGPSRGSLRGGRARGSAYQPLSSGTGTGLNQSPTLPSPRQSVNTNYSSFEGSYENNSAWNTQSYSSDYDSSYDQLYSPRYGASYDANYTLDYSSQSSDWTSDRYSY